MARLLGRIQPLRDTVDHGGLVEEVEVVYSAVDRGVGGFELRR